MTRHEESSSRHVRRVDRKLKCGDIRNSHI